jgi:quercetin dioxygenase-like cupin family protein
MTPTDRSAPPAVEFPTYRGRGTEGWRVASDGGRQEVVAIEAGHPFGGEWPERQEWRILDGQGWLTWDAPFRRVRVTAGHRYRFEPGERRLVVAESAMRILITSLEDMATSGSLPGV